MRVPLCAGDIAAFLPELRISAGRTGLFRHFDPVTALLAVGKHVIVAASADDFIARIVIAAGRAANACFLLRPVRFSTPDAAFERFGCHLMAVYALLFGDFLSAQLAHFCTAERPLLAPGALDQGVRKALKNAQPIARCRSFLALVIRQSVDKGFVQRVPDFRRQLFPEAENSDALFTVSILRREQASTTRVQGSSRNRKNLTQDLSPTRRCPAH